MQCHFLVQKREVVAFNAQIRQEEVAIALPFVQFFVDSLNLVLDHTRLVLHWRVLEGKEEKEKKKDGMRIQHLPG